jgi:hypothetical protein
MENFFAQLVSKPDSSPVNPIERRHKNVEAELDSILGAGASPRNPTELGD